MSVPGETTSMEEEGPQAPEHRHIGGIDESEEFVYEQSDLMEEKNRGSKGRPKPNLLKTEKNPTNFDSGEWGIKLDQESRERALEMEVESQASKMEQKLKEEGRFQVEKDSANSKISFPVRDVKVGLFLISEERF